MADVRDEFGNPIQMTDERGNPVQLTDEHGNPMHLSGVAFHQGTDVVAAETKVEAKVAGATEIVHGGAPQGLETERKKEEKLNKSSSSSSSEDDGQGGRRKKKGIKERIKEKLHVGKHTEEHGQHPTTVASETRPGEFHGEQEHEKKSMMEKFKEKLPGHH